MREAFVALADAEPLVGKLFDYRFKKGTDLWGYNFGDLFLRAMTDVAGDLEKAVKESSKVLAVRGHIVLSTLANISLIAHHQDKTETIGKENILNSVSPIERVYLRPHSAKASPEFISAITKADAVIIAPGALYTETIPPLLLEGVKEAFAASKAVTIYVMNLMTTENETERYRASDHLKAITGHLGVNRIDYCIVNKGRIPDDLLKAYAQEGVAPVEIDAGDLAKLGTTPVEETVVESAGPLIRHDPLRLTGIFLDLISESRKRKPHARPQD